jgi:hypothetical protein
MSRSCWRSFEKVLLAAILFSDESPMIHWKLAEGVGFEPTVGCPTLDFESSALNRTQPPFLVERRKRRTSNIECNCLRDSALSVGRWNLSVVFSPSSGLPDPPGRQDSVLTKQKNVTIKGLPCLASLLHLVCPHGQPRYYLLLTGIHRFLAPLFTSILILF